MFNGTFGVILGQVNYNLDEIYPGGVFLDTLKIMKIMDLLQGTVGIFRTDGFSI